MTMLAMMARRNEFHPAMTAATSASDRVWSPVWSRPLNRLARDQDDRKGGERGSQRQTRVETVLGLMATVGQLGILGRP